MTAERQGRDVETRDQPHSKIVDVLKQIIPEFASFDAHSVVKPARVKADQQRKSGGQLRRKQQGGHSGIIDFKL